MKHVIIVMAAAALVAGCQKSIDQRFDAMCAEQKADPEAPRIGEEQCANPAEVGPETRKITVEMYERQRARLEAAQ